MYDQTSLKIPDPTQTVEHSLMQESDDEENSGSLSSNYDMFACENSSISAAAEACTSFGGAGSFSDFDQGTTLESLGPFDLNLQHCHSAPSTDMAMTGNYKPGIQDGFLNQEPAVVSDTFPIDYQWNGDAIALSAGDVAPGSVNTPMTTHTANEDSDSRTVLTLYNVKSETLNSILETAFRSKTKIKMETYH